MKYPAVYSYKKSRTRELELSIETLKNIDCWNGKVIIVGDDPKLETEYMYYPIKYTWGKGNKATDETCAYLTACDIVGDFILMSDDIYILKPWKLTRHNRGELFDHAEKRRFSDSYKRQLNTTRIFLEAHNKPTLSYEIHIPMLVMGEQLKEINNIIPHSRSGVFIRTVIGNWFGEPSTYLNDPKNQPLTTDSVLYSSSDSTFNYEKVKSYLK